MDASEDYASEAQFKARSLSVPLTTDEFELIERRVYSTGIGLNNNGLLYAFMAGFSHYSEARGGSECELEDLVVQLGGKLLAEG